MVGCFDYNFFPKEQVVGFSKHLSFFIFEERVCDTLVDLEEDKTQRDECINVPSLVCTTEEKTVFEKVIFISIKFSYSEKATKF